MSSTNLYSQGLMFVDGILVADEVSFTVKYNTNNQVVLTQAHGVAGITPGADEVDISIVSAIARAGYELDYYKRATQRLPVEVVRWMGTQKISYKGFIMTIDEKAGVNTTSEATIDIKAGKPDVQ